MKIKIISLLVLFCFFICFAPSPASEAEILSSSNLKRLSKAIKQNKVFLAKHLVQFQNISSSYKEAPLYALYFYDEDSNTKTFSSTCLHYFKNQSYHCEFEEYAGGKCIKKEVVKKMTEKEANDFLDEKYFSGHKREKKLELLALINSISLD